MIAKLSKKKKIDKKTIILIGLLIIIISITLILLINAEELKQADIDITKNLQNNLINKYKSIPTFLEFVNFLNNIYFPFVIIAIIFSFYTVYDCFILVNILSIDSIICFIFKMFYSKPPYQLEDDKNEVKIYYCGYGWGFPSEESIIMTSFFLSIWKILNKYSINYNQNQIKIKYCILIFIFLLIFVNSFGILLMGYYYLSHIIISILIGIMIYLLILESNFINLLNGEEFILFINNKYIHYIIVNLSIFVFLSFLYIIQRLSFNSKYKICETITNEKIFAKSGKYSYIDGNYIFVFLFLGNIFAALGIIADINLTHGGIEANYLQFNFRQELEEISDNRSRSGDSSFNRSIDITKETMWNNTSLLISLLRLIVVILFFGICFIPYFLVDLTNSNITLILFIKILLPSIIFYLGIFYYLKPFLRLLKLTNYTLESILRDN